MSISRVYSATGGSGRPILAMIDISSQVNGSAQVFTIKPYRRASLIVIYNGLIQLSNDITILNAVQFRTNFIPQLGSSLAVLIQQI
jgi:hypothetical protein